MSNFQWKMLSGQMLHSSHTDHAVHKQKKNYTIHWIERRGVSMHETVETHSQVCGLDSRNENKFSHVEILAAAQACLIVKHQSREEPSD